MSQVISAYAQIELLPDYSAGLAELGRKDQANGYAGLNERSEVISRTCLIRDDYIKQTINIGDNNDTLLNSVVGEGSINLIAIGRGCFGIGTPGVHRITDSVVIGTRAGQYFRHGNGTVLCGNYNFQNCADSDHNTGYGDSVFRGLTSGSNNTGMGYVVSNGQTSGSWNVHIGSYAAYLASTGNQNVMIGCYAGAKDIGYEGTIGSYNIAIGYSAFRHGSGANNIGMGFETLFNCEGSYNVAIGNQSGKTIDNATASDNIFLGRLSGTSTGVQKVDAVNTIAIGYNTYTTKDNQTVIGNTSVTEAIIRGNILSVGGMSMSGSWQGTYPTNGAIWKSSNYVYFTMGSGGFQFNKSDNSGLSPLAITTTGQVNMNPPASATPPYAGQMTFEKTSDTSLTIKVKGSDNVVRSAVLALA